MSKYDLKALPTEEKITPVRNLNDLWRYSLENPEDFWAGEAKQLEWIRTWDSVLTWRNRFAKWFVGGVLNASYNCLDKHIKMWRKNKAAIIWEGEPGDKRVLTYHSLYREVNLLASVLRNLGVEKGKFVALYMPMIPELPITMLACSRVGAPFTQIYSGFSEGALAERVRDTQAKILVTADGLWRRGKIIDLKGIVNKAVKKCPSIEKIIIVNRTDHKIEMDLDRDIWYHEALKKAEGKYVPPEPLESDHILYVLYTSGTTAKPKGAQVCT